MSKGLYSWEESAGLSFAGLKGQSVRCMVQMEDEVFFAGTDKGVFRLTKAGAQVLRLLRRGRLTCIQRCMWNRSMSSERSCSSVPFQTAYLCLTVPKQIHSLNDRIPHVPIRSFARTKDNCCWWEPTVQVFFAWMSLPENFEPLYE